jgi:hypothetical protein
MALGFPDFALNNTYDLPTYSKEVAEMVLGNITAPDVGCLALVDKCRAAVAKDDPESTGTNNEVNEICLKAMGVCFGAVTIYDEVSPVGLPPMTKLQIKIADWDSLVSSF